MPAEWAWENGGWVIALHAASVREAYSTGLIVVSVAFGIAGGGVTYLAAAQLVAAVLVGILLCLLCLSFVGYLRLGAQVREVQLGISEQSLTVAERGVRLTVPLRDIDRLLLVLDGAPARVGFRAGPVGLSWSIGNLHRNNSVQRYIAEMPVAAEQWLSDAGLHRSVVTHRGVTRIEYRGSSKQRSSARY